MIRASLAAVIAAGVVAFSASAQPGGMRPAQSKNYICPAQVPVKMVPTNAFALGLSGWKANEGPFNVQLDPANPPKISGGNMVCSYKLLNQPGVFLLYQPVGAWSCSPTSDGKGFVCTH